ncbi:MAG: GtrA family protein [Methylococcales bacterium]
MIKKELLRFLVAGFSAVGTDASTYAFMLKWLDEPLAKGISFILGSIVAFIINKYWTFESASLSMSEIFRFGVLYLFTLFVNVTVNQSVLLIESEYLLFAFLMATGASTILNFLGMKFWVFR